MTTRDLRLRREFLLQQLDMARRDLSAAIAAQHTAETARLQRHVLALLMDLQTMKEKV